MPAGGDRVQWGVCVVQQHPAMTGHIIEAATAPKITSAQLLTYGDKVIAATGQPDRVVDQARPALHSTGLGVVERIAQQRCLQIDRAMGGKPAASMVQPSAPIKIHDF